MNLNYLIDGISLEQEERNLLGDSDGINIVLGEVTDLYYLVGYCDGNKYV